MYLRMGKGIVTLFHSSSQKTKCKAIDNLLHSAYFLLLEHNY